MHYFVYVQDLLGVEINRSDFVWSYGVTAPEMTEKHFQHCLIRLHITVCDDDQVFDKADIAETGQPFSYFTDAGRLGSLTYNRAFLGRQLRYAIRIKQNDVYVWAGKNYYRMVRSRIMNLHALRYVLFDIVSGLFLLNGYAPLYCSAVYQPKTDNATLIFSPPNMGKTVSCFQLCQRYGSVFMSEDIAVTDGETVWAVPWTNSSREYLSDKSWCTRVKKRVNRVFPIFEALRSNQNKSALSIMGTEKIVHKSRAGDVVLLERGESATGINYDNIENKLLLLNHYLFNCYKAPGMIVLNYFNPDFSLEKMSYIEKNILEKLISNTHSICVAEEDAMAYADVIFREVTERPQQN